MSKQVDILISLNRTVIGLATWWGDASNVAQDVATDRLWVLRDAGVNCARSRCLCKFDLSSIPRNSYIQSATLRLKVVHYDAAKVASFDMAIYPCQVTPWDVTATMQYYASTNAWQTFGMEPNKDYFGTYLQKKTVSAAICPDNSLHEFDLTAYVQSAIDRDDMTLLCVVKTEDAWEKANALVAGGGGSETTLSFCGTSEADPNKKATLRIVYTEPLAFFDSNADGTINTGQEIFLGEGRKRIGSVVYDPNQTAYQETPAKIFVKNQLNNTTMKGVTLESPANWATFPLPDPANVGTGTCSDVSTSPTLTIDEQWKVQFTAPTAFTVYRDTGTGDVPGGTQTWTQDGTGTVGNLYSSATRGISFTITAGGTAFVSGDKFTWRSYKDYSITGAASDADYLFQISKDNGGSPDGNWYFARPAMTTLTSGVSGGNLLSVALAKYFNTSNKVKIFRRSSKVWTAEYTIQSVNKANNTITLVESVTADAGDWLHISRLNFGDIAPGGAVPLWARGVSFTDTVKQEKYQYLRAKENI